MNRPKINDKSL